MQQPNSHQFKPQESLFSVQNETSSQDLTTSGALNSGKSKNIVFAKNQSLQKKVSHRDGNQQEEFGALVIHNISQMSIKNDMPKIGVMERMNTNSLNTDLRF